MATLTGAPKDQTLSDDFLAQWRHYLDHLVPELTDTVDYWQIGNQVNTFAEMEKLRPGVPGAFFDLYANMLRIAYEVIKVNESSDLVLVGGLNNLAGKDVPGVDPLSFIKTVNYNCQPLCYDAINMYIDWGDLLPDQNRTQKWGESEKEIAMADYLRLAYYDFYSLAKEAVPIWITGPGLSVEQINNFAHARQIDFYEAQSDLIIRQIAALTPHASMIFYRDLPNYTEPHRLGQSMVPLVSLLTGSQPYSEWPVYSTNGDRLEQAHDFRFIRENKRDVILIWSDNPSDWGLPARFRHLTGDTSRIQRLIDYPGAGMVTEISSNTEFMLKQGITLLLSEAIPSTSLVIGETLPAGYGQYSPILSWWVGAPKFFLTYDNSKWERRGDYLVSIEHPDCRIWPPLASDGPRDQLRHETSSVLVGNTELRIDRDVDINTNISTMDFYTIRDNFAFILYKGEDANEPCQAALMEILMLSEPGDFGIEPDAN